MEDSERVSKYAELFETVDGIAASLQRALWNSLPQHLRGFRVSMTTGVPTGSVFDVRGSIDILDSGEPRIYYKVSERRQTYNNTILGSTYALSGSELDLVLDTSGFAQLIAKIRHALNRSFLNHVMVNPPFIRNDLYASTTNTTTSAMPGFTYTTVSYTPDGGYNQIDIDPYSTHELMTRTGKLKTPEQIAEERALESIRRSLAS